MRIELDKILEKLGIDYILHPYETVPWFYYDEEKGIACSAEVRMGPEAQDLEAEVQFIRDDDYDGPWPPLEPEPEEDEDEEEGAAEGEGDGDGPSPEEDPEDLGPDIMEQLEPGVPFQVMWMQLLPVNSQQFMAEQGSGTDLTQQWEGKRFNVKRIPFENKMSSWDEKACDMFRACIESMQMEEIPDIEQLIEDVLFEGGAWGGGRRGRVGRKSPKVKPGALMGMKKGM